jgi:hypothetical protein
MVQQIEDESGELPASLPRGVPPEVAAANADVVAIIVPRLTMLMEIANSFLSTIIDSMESVPYGIRWICKQIRSLTRVRLLSMTGPGWVADEMIEKIPGGNRRINLLAHWRLLLFTIHQSRNRDSASVHVGRRSSRQTPTSYSDPRECLAQAIG